MSVIVKGMEMPISCDTCTFGGYGGLRNEIEVCSINGRNRPKGDGRANYCPLVEIPPHGRLIDADALRAEMYHEAFETDSELQMWDSGCWVRYKMFETHMDNAPTIIEAEE